MDSLSDSYKCPECYGGERGSTGYHQGDTWYRDMRAPGFNGEVAKGQRDSLQWLGYRIANDPRFAAATVRFWWPAVFGAEPLNAPEDLDGPNYDQRLKAFNEQEQLVNELAWKFEASGFRAKALFADMAMSKWYRHSEGTRQRRRGGTLSWPQWAVVACSRQRNSIGRQKLFLGAHGVNGSMATRTLIM